MQMALMQAFRVDEHAFRHISGLLLEPHIAKQDTRLRKAWPVEVRVAVLMAHYSLALFMRNTDETRQPGWMPRPWQSKV